MEFFQVIFLHGEVWPFSSLGLRRRKYNGPYFRKLFSITLSFWED